MHFRGVLFKFIRLHWFRGYILIYGFGTLYVSADVISCVEFNHDGDMFATGDKGGRVVIFQRDPAVSIQFIL